VTAFCLLAAAACGTLPDTDALVKRNTEALLAIGKYRELMRRPELHDANPNGIGLRARSNNRCRSDAWNSKILRLELAMYGTVALTPIQWASFSCR
jgi:hypothetical protein